MITYLYFYNRVVFTHAESNNLGLYSHTIISQSTSAKYATAKKNTEVDSEYCRSEEDDKEAGSAEKVVVM